MPNNCQNSVLIIRPRLSPSCTGSVARALCPFRLQSPYPPLSSSDSSAIKNPLTGSTRHHQALFSSSKKHRRRSAPTQESLPCGPTTTWLGPISKKGARRKTILPLGKTTIPILPQEDSKSLRLVPQAFLMAVLLLSFVTLVLRNLTSSLLFE